MQRNPVPPGFPSGPTCRVCGAMPASDLGFTEVIGLLIARRYRDLEAFFCRDCALAVGRATQSKTLIFGWWSPTALLHNLYAVIRNWNSLSKANAMTPPIPGGRSAPGLDPGKPLFRRAGGIAVLMVAASLSFQLVTANAGRPRPSSPNTGASLSSYGIATCIALTTDGIAEPISCDSAHDGQIASGTTLSGVCPSWTEGYINDGVTKWCVDTDS